MKHVLSLRTIALVVFSYLLIAVILRLTAAGDWRVALLDERLLHAALASALLFAFGVGVARWINDAQLIAPYKRGDLRQPGGDDRQAGAGRTDEVDGVVRRSRIHHMETLRDADIRREGLQFSDGVFESRCFRNALKRRKMCAVASSISLRNGHSPMLCAVCR